MPTMTCAQRSARFSHSRRYASKPLGAPAEAGIAPRRALERQVVMLLRIGDAEAVGHDIQEGNCRYRKLLRAVPRCDMEYRVIGACGHPHSERAILELSIRRRLPRSEQPPVRLHGIELDLHSGGHDTARDVH